jgi:hypothetical protein
MTETVEPTTECTENDLTVRYKWFEGSLPPPYHYEYEIQIGPGPVGKIIFIPDYKSADVPVWEREFEISEGEYGALLYITNDQGVFKTDWQENPDPPVGGHGSYASFTYCGQEASVPSFLKDDQYSKIKPIYNMVEGLVPEEIRQELNAKHEAYMQENEE